MRRLPAACGGGDNNADASDNAAADAIADTDGCGADCDAPDVAADSEDTGGDASASLCGDLVCDEGEGREQLRHRLRAPGVW